jgi:phosphatidylglycerophosphate synthase
MNDFSMATKKFTRRPRGTEMAVCGSRQSMLDPCLGRDAVLNGLAAIVLTIGMGFGLDGVLGLSDTFVAKAVAALGVALLVLARFLSLHRPHVRLGPANQVTLLRAVLTALLAALLGEGSTPAVAWTALTLALVAAGLDGLDGHLARRWAWASPFGARFDMEMDALLVAVLSVLLWSSGKAGPWVLASGFLRYLFVGAGYVWPWLRRPLPLRRRRQAICVLQILTLTLALAPVLPATWSAPLAAAGLTLLCYSFAVDFVWLARRAGPNLRTQARR